ncbi:MAG: radical SAM protein [Myxococcales bacterium]|nr:radical SAM protein [Myxococcales bacterium]
MTVREYHVAVCNEGARETFELVFDIYPQQAPAHPERHYGHWNKRIELDAGEQRDIVVRWDAARKAVAIDGEPADSSWRGPLDESGRYDVSFLLYRQGQVVTEHKMREDVGGSASSASSIVLPCGGDGAVRTQPQSQLRSAVWFITWRCNYKCDYCWEVQRIRRGEMKAEPYEETQKWVDAWNRLRPQTLDISGGEPFLQPGFIDMLEAFDDSIRVAITSNISKDITEFVQRIKPEKVFSMTLSFHPTQKVAWDMFLGKALLLKNRGFNVTVNFVSWPEQLWLIPIYKKVFETSGLRFHVDPYAPTPHYPFTLSDAEREFLKPFVGGDREHFFGETERYNVDCSGGYEHLNVHPDGDAYRCISDKHFGKPKVGNIFDPDFSLSPKFTFCDDYWRCPGCDKDKVRVERRPEPWAPRDDSGSMTL